MIDFDQIIKRMLEVENIPTEKELSDLFGLSPQNFNKKKKRGTLFELIINWAISKKVDLNWVLTGDEPCEQADKSKIVVDHICVIQKFKDKQKAKEFNEILVELESVDQSKFYEALGWIKRELQSIKEETSPKIKNAVLGRK